MGQIKGEDPELCVLSARRDCTANASHSISVLGDSDSIKCKSFYKTLIKLKILRESAQNFAALFTVYGFN
jgi:hypothetical protein